MKAGQRMNVKDWGKRVLEPEVINFRIKARDLTEDKDNIADCNNEV